MLIVSIAGCAAQEGGSFNVQYTKSIYNAETDRYDHFHSGHAVIDINLWDSWVRWNSRKEERYTCQVMRTRSDGAKVATCSHNTNRNKSITLHFDEQTGLFIGGVKVWRVYDHDTKIYRIVRTEFSIVK